MGRGHQSDWEYFDDCAVCRAMREAEKRGRPLTAQELFEAIAKANAESAERDEDLY